MKQLARGLTMRSHTHARQAFTLIEVLVVVAIIALLISILLPSLQAARGEAKFVVCQSNIRQMGMGMSYFANEHKDYYPDQDRWLTWQPWPAGPLTGGAPNAEEFTAPKANPKSGREEGWLLRYVKNPQAYLCPMDTGERFYANGAGGLYAMPPGHTSYAMNGALQGLANGHYEGQLDQIKPPFWSEGSRDPMSYVWFKDNILLDSPSKVFVMMEEAETSVFNDGYVDWEGFWTDTLRPQRDQVTVRHRGGKPTSTTGGGGIPMTKSALGRGALSMFDGHVETIYSDRDFNAPTMRAWVKSGRLYSALYADGGNWKIRTRPFKQPTDEVVAKIGQ
jgi:prepilin-type N-terminal cleavage/methylation domain-containing protein